MKNITTLIEKYKEMLSAIEDTLNDEQDIDAKLILKSSKVVIKEIIRDLESLESEDECKCMKPSRESGFDYCHDCNKHVSPKRMDEIINQS